MTRTVYVGVPGLARDAAAAALARQLAASPPAPTPVPPLPQVRARGWEITVERWLTAVIAPASTSTPKPTKSAPPAS